MQPTDWAIILEPEVVETSGWLQNVPDRNTPNISILPAMAYDVPFLRHAVTSNKTRFLQVF